MHVFRIIGRILLLLAMLSGIAALWMQMEINKRSNELDFRYLPSDQSLQMHADRLASLFLERLMQPPPSLLPGSLEQPFDSLKFLALGPAPSLATGDLPKRYPIRWRLSSGWVTEPPPMHADFLTRFFSNMINRPDKSVPSMVQISMDPMNRDQPMILAGAWSFAADDIEFNGAYTPVRAFYREYAPRWFEEYRKTTFGILLDSWIWQPAEIRLIPHEVDRDTVILHRSGAVDVNRALGMDKLESASPAAASVASMLNTRINPDPGWRDETEWFEASLFPLSDKIEIATPFRMDLEFQRYSQRLAWWAMIMLALGTLVFVADWIIYLNERARQLGYRAGKK